MTEVAPPAAKPMGLASRLVGVIFSPYKAYAAVAQRPRWFGALIISALLIGGSQSWLLTNEGIRADTVDQQVQTMEALGIPVTDQAYDQLERQMEWAPITQPISLLVGLPIINLLFAGLLMGIFTAIMGGNATFRQIYAVVAHSSFATAVAAVLIAPVNFVREQMSSPLRLNALLPMFDEETAVGMFLGMIDLQFVWLFVNLAIGIGVLYKRRTGPIMSSFLGVYVVIVLIITGIRLAL